jgi:poly(hydroxyalkanoate) depolymerase family esterase
MTGESRNSTNLRMVGTGENTNVTHLRMALNHNFELVRKFLAFVLSSVTVMKSLHLIIFLFLSLSSFAQLERVRHFGRNKGHLKMYVHIPPGIDQKKAVPMVVVLHGCLQCAGSVAAQTGWNKLADEYGFYVLYPQQRVSNNPEKCFRWYKRRQLKKNKGENASIIQMVRHMRSIYSIDSSNVHITGLSAGAAMSVIMMADYPETFSSGAIFAGGPYKAANGMVQGMMGMLGWRLKSPQKWGDLVRKQNPGYKGDYPRMIIYHGNSDRIVNKRNGNELMEQWTNLHGIGTEPSQTIRNFLGKPGIEKNIFLKEGKEAVIFYKVDDLGHALIVDPGNCRFQGGRTGFFSKDKNYNSTLWTAYDMGIIPAPVISGKTTVDAGESGLSYVVAANPDATYEWSFPADCKIIGDEKSNVIVVEWGKTGGNVNVTEISGDGCRKEYESLEVKCNR